MSPNVKGAVLALLAFGVYATHDVVVKTLGATYSPVQLIFFSVLFSFPLAMMTIMRDAKPATLIPVNPGWVIARTIAAVITGLSAFYAFSVLPLAQVYAMLFATPLILTVLAIPVLGEKVGLHRGFAVIAGLIGVMIVLRPGTTDLSLGHAAGLTAALGSAFASVVLRKIGAEERAVVVMLYPMVANFLLNGAALAFVYRPMPIEHLGLAAIIAALGWTAGLITIRAFSTGEAVVVAPMQYSQILWAIAYGLIFFDETIDAITALGAAVIIASGLYIVFREGRTRASAFRPVLRARMRPDTGIRPTENSGAGPGLGAGQ
ncbi:MAG: DMT family transporter [Rhodobacteraceae bacterium]|nr:DMT family transporter [Paracoccaceae bacterium]